MGWGSLGHQSLSQAQSSRRQAIPMSDTALALSSVPWVQLKIAEFQTWPSMRVRSAMSAGAPSPAACTMRASIVVETRSRHSVTPGSSEDMATRRAAPSFG